jgi:hypothetical protein
MLLGMTALSWIILVPAVACWPAAGYLVYRVHQAGRRHDEREALERARLLAAHQQVAAAGQADSESPGA